MRSAHLDASFAALADATRRGVLEQLGREEASITDLADRFHMTLTGMRKHVGVLEQAGLVVTEKVGRVRTCRIGARRLEEVAAWIERYHQLWDARFGELDQVIEELKRKEKSDGRKQAQMSSPRRRTSRPWNGSPIARSSSRASFDAPARLVFEAWSKPELFKRGGCRSRWA